MSTSANDVAFLVFASIEAVDHDSVILLVDCVFLTLLNKYISQFPMYVPRRIDGYGVRTCAPRLGHGAMLLLLEQCSALSNRIHVNVAGYRLRKEIVQETLEMRLCLERDRFLSPFHDRQTLQGCQNAIFTDMAECILLDYINIAHTIQSYSATSDKVIRLLDPKS